jgi:hypothetical protein
MHRWLQDGERFWGRKQMDMTEAARRWAHKQALASARIEGFEPSAVFLADCEELNAGRITDGEFSARSALRASAVEKTGQTLG